MKYTSPPPPPASTMTAMCAPSGDQTIWSTESRCSPGRRTRSELAPLRTSIEKIAPPRAPNTNRVPSGDHAGADVTSPTSSGSDPTSVVSPVSGSIVLNEEPAMLVWSGDVSRIVASSAPVEDHANIDASVATWRGSCDALTTHSPMPSGPGASYATHRPSADHLAE